MSLIKESNISNGGNNTSDDMLIRECIICKLKIQQENLCAHYSAHFYESSRCKLCDKIQTNPSSYVTHMSCHTDAQYFCTGCSKWFKLVIVYKRHKRECNGTKQITHNDESSETKNEEENQTNKIINKTQLKDLTSFGTYKVRIKCNSIKRTKQNNEANAHMKNNQLKRSKSNATRNETTSVKKTFECPECDKKFVSHFGLFQHFDTHPNLAVTCPLCDIVFPNHNALIQHNDKLHRNDKNISQFTPENEKSMSQEAEDTVNQEVLQVANSRKSSNSSRNTTKEITPRDYTTTSTTTRDSLAYGINTVLTRNLRLAAPKLINQTQSVLYNKSGFEDLAFISFSSFNFPRIAQFYCELYPRKVNSHQQILHNYTCPQCAYSFPCESSLKLHLNSLKHDCTLYMQSQVEYRCIRQTLNELVNEIETRLEVPNDNKTKFLRCVGLVSRDTYETQVKTCKERQFELRREMCEINTDFIHDINKYKLRISETLIDCLQKIQLKPNVNSNKTLLVRSKKLKRTQRPLNSKIIYSNSNEIASILALNSNTKVTPKKRMYNKVIREPVALTQPLTPVPPLVTSPASPPLPPTQPQMALTQITSQPQPKFSIKFSMTSGNFSGSSIITNKKRKNDDLLKEEKERDEEIKRAKTFSIESQVCKIAPPLLQKVFSEEIDGEKSKVLLKNNNHHHHHHHPPKLKPLTPNDNKKTSPKIKLNTSNTNGIFYAKCKHCSCIFRGENEILQHVLDAHQKLVKERLNRAKSLNTNLS